MRILLSFICGMLFCYYVSYKKRSYTSDKKENYISIQEQQDRKTAYCFYDAANFHILGQLPQTQTYTRLPKSAEHIVRTNVWNLSKNSAGISIRFQSNATKIAVRWILKNNFTISNMTPIAAKGFDLYAYTEGVWRFVGSAKPTEHRTNESVIISDMSAQNREYLLNLPLYDGVSSIEIGVDTGASINKPIHPIISNKNPIVLYGTSITQGASASRPGLIYGALLQRFLQKEVINLGFSGNGKFEKTITPYIMSADPSLIILDCTPNSDAQTIQGNLPALIDDIRSKNSTVPILLVESIVRDYAYFKKNDSSVFGSLPYINGQNYALRCVYEEKIKMYKKIFYISQKELIDVDRYPENTIDGTHLSDIGHYQIFKALLKKIFEIFQSTAFLEAVFFNFKYTKIPEVKVSTCLQNIKYIVQYYKIRI
jgi:lysophospholipase L1-like esterase